jgi:hypothetical protein
MKSKRKHFLALSLAGIGAIGAFASVNAASIQAGIPNKERDQVRTAIKQAFTVGDYQAYLVTTKDYKVGVPVLTEAQFNAMVQAEKLRTSGDKVGAKKLLDEAGIKPPMQNKKTSHGDRGVKKGMPAPTDAQKATMKQAQDLIKAGKQAEAKTLLDTAGIKMPGKGVGSDTRKTHSPKSGPKSTTAPVNGITPTTP